LLPGFNGGGLRQIGGSSLTDAKIAVRHGEPQDGVIPTSYVPFRNAHLLAAAAEAMRHILIDRARQRSAVRHGGNQQRVDIDHIDIPIDTEDEEQLLAVNAALDKLAIDHPQAAELVKLRCFVGLEISEAARVLQIPRATAYRRWQFARTWLYQELHP